MNVCVYLMLAERLHCKEWQLYGGRLYVRDVIRSSFANVRTFPAAQHSVQSVASKSWRIWVRRCCDVATSNIA